MMPSSESTQRMALGIVGVGKIARDRHLPALAATSLFDLVAAASREGRVAGLANYPDIESMVQGEPALQAVSLCVPPGPRARIARVALAAGLHVMLEKPPGLTVCEVLDLQELARQKGVGLFASWHSREASGVPKARAWLANRHVRDVRVRWLEDVRVWHPGQHWIWQAGGFGVFDPGVNALSILTRILPGELSVQTARLEFPQNAHTPLRASLRLRLQGEEVVSVTLDFDHRAGEPCWDIEVDTDAGILSLSKGGEQLRIEGVETPVPAGDEYERLYSRFATLARSAQSDVDLRPLQLAADAFLCAERIQIDPFHW